MKHPRHVTVLRLAPGAVCIFHTASGLCLWSGDSHASAWEHVENGPPITNGRVKRPPRREAPQKTPKIGAS